MAKPSLADQATARYHKLNRSVNPEDPDDVLAHYWSEGSTDRGAAAPKRDRGQRGRSSAQRAEAREYPLPGKGKQKKKGNYPKYDRKTIRVMFREEDKPARWFALGNELRKRLIDVNRAHYANRHRFLSGNELSARIPKLKEERPALRDLPAEAARAVAEGVVKDFISLVKSGDGAALAQPVRSLTVAYLKFRVRRKDEDSYSDEDVEYEVHIPKVGWRPFKANGALRNILGGAGLKIYGGWLWKRDEEWRLTVSFKRTDRRQIKGSVLAARGGYVVTTATRAEAEADAERAAVWAKVARALWPLGRHLFPGFGGYACDYGSEIAVPALVGELARGGAPVTARRLIGLMRFLGVEPRRRHRHHSENSRVYTAGDLLRALLGSDYGERVDGYGNQGEDDVRSC